MSKQLKLGERAVGPGCPTLVIAEIGINHNGSLALAKQLIDVAVDCGCDAVKFQKRDVEQCVPAEVRETPRETPWGVLSYVEYRRRIEFGVEDYRALDAYCRNKNILWFASCWDVPSIEFLSPFDPPCLKIPSAALTNGPLLESAHAAGRALMLSTGMSTMEEIREAVALVGVDRLLLAHCTSAYPCRPEELNLRMIGSLAREFACPVGYSGHETGLATTVAAVALGAAFIERHITLDRSMWGTDQSASLEPAGLRSLVQDVRTLERALGDGIKQVYDSERDALHRLRGVRNIFPGQ